MQPGEVLNPGAAITSASLKKSAKANIGEPYWSADPFEQIRQLARLKDGRLLTLEEFNQKKAEILARI
jgi:hypothetical protein